MHPSNWQHTGGTVCDRVRTLPTYEIVLLDNGFYGVKDERQGGRFVGTGFSSPERIIKLFGAQSRQRTGG